MQTFPAIAAHPVTGAPNPAALYLAGLAPSGRRAMGGLLSRCLRLMGASQGDAKHPDLAPWHTLNFSHVAALRAALLDQNAAPATVNMALCAVRGVVAVAANLGTLPEGEAARIRKVKGVAGSRVPRGKALEPEALALLFAACDDETTTGARDAAALALLFAGGLRRLELTLLTLGDYNPTTGELLVKGKGNRERVQFVTNGAALALQDWLAIRGKAGAGEPSEPLFIRIYKGGRLSTEPLSTQAIYNLVANRAALAKLPPMSPHDLRRSFVPALLEQGADLATVQRLAGHASIVTTTRYDRRGEKVLRLAVNRLCVPYSRPARAV